MIAVVPALSRNPNRVIYRKEQVVVDPVRTMAAAVYRSRLRAGTTREVRVRPHRRSPRLQHRAQHRREIVPPVGFAEDRRIPAEPIERLEGLVAVAGGEKN